MQKHSILKLSLSINKSKSLFFKKGEKKQFIRFFTKCYEKIERKNFIDVILFAFAIYLLFTTNWSNVDKFSQLLLLMYALLYYTSHRQHYENKTK